MSAESFSHSIVVPTPREQVWSALDQPDTWEAVAGVDRVHEPIIDAGGRLRGFLFDTMVAGRAYEGRATPHDRVESHVMAWNISNSQITGVIRVELTDVSDGTRIDVGVEMRAASMMSRMFFGVISRTVAEGLPGTVEEMAERF